jgi:hypothetical protein
MRYLQRAAGAAFLLTATALVVFWTVKNTKPSGDAVLPILYGVLGASALAWLVAEGVRLRHERSTRRTGDDDMNRLIRRQYRGLKRGRLLRRLRHEPVPKEQRLMETTEPPPPDDPTPAAADQHRAPRITHEPSDPTARNEVGRIHEQDLHGRLSGIARSVAQNSTTGYAGFPGGADQDERSVAAHFPDLIPPLVKWDAAVARAQVAPDAARAQVERAVAAADIPPGYHRQHIAEIIARFVVVHPDYRIVLRAVQDDFRNGEWSVFTASGRGMDLKVAQLPNLPIEEIKERAGAHEAALQSIVDSVRDSDLIPEIGESRAALEGLKEPLLDLVRLKQAVSPILFAADCSYCEAQLQPVAPVILRSGSAATVE